MDLEQIEAFCRAHQFTLQALSAAATLAAVIVSVAVSYLGARSNRTRLKAVASIVRVVVQGQDNAEPPRFLVVDVTNTGNLALWLDWGFFNWHVPFSGEYGTVNPLDAYGLPIPGVPGFPEPVRYPVEILPRSTRRFRLSTLQVFNTSNVEVFNRTTWMRRIRYRLQRAMVVTADSRKFRVRLADTVKRELARAAG